MQRFSLLCYLFLFLSDTDQVWRTLKGFIKGSILEPSSEAGSNLGNGGKGERFRQKGGMCGNFKPERE